jgi:hypothetical protein
MSGSEVVTRQLFIVEMCVVSEEYKPKSKYVADLPPSIGALPIISQVLYLAANG